MKSKNFIIFFLTIEILFTLNIFSQKKKKDSLDVKIGQMLLVGFRGSEISDKDQFVKYLKKYHLGGVILFDYDVEYKKPMRNIENFDQVKNLCSSLQKLVKIPLIISIDQEGGRVCRLKTKYGFPPSVSAQYLGSLNNLDSTKYYAEQTAKLLSGLGINLNFAPCVDVNLNPENPVIGKIERSFSSNPDSVTIQANEIINIFHKYGVYCTLKHFPGHGSSKDDSHLGVVDVTNTWDRSELTPYAQLINKGNCDVIMTAHIFNSKLDQNVPATLSKNVMTHILRDSLKFNGVIVSDDMQMKAIADNYGLEFAIKSAINAGVDILTFANNAFKYEKDIAPKAIKIIKKLVKSGEISKKRINEAFSRIMKLKSQLKTNI